ncbi:MAG: ribonuclease Z [Verrucomicrobia bacterium]|nr:ribonuclease Z [Verrucomicrobiota bacterium]
MGLCSVRCFGVGDGFPSADRGHSGFLYQLGDTSLIIDCGDGFTSHYEAAGLSYDLGDAFLLSHQHADHVGGFQMFLQSLWLRQRQKAVRVFMGEDGIEPLKKFCHAGYLFDELFNFQLSYTPLKSGKAFPIGHARITPFRTTHLDSFATRFGKKYEQNFDAFSFLIETPDHRIAHSADLGTPEDLAPLLQDDVDVLVCELAHFKPEQLFAFLAGEAITKLILVHLTAKLWADRKAVLAAARAKLPGVEISIAQQGEEFTF